VDEKGTINYSPLPPPEQSAEEIRIGTRPAATAASMPSPAPAPASQAADTEPPTGAPADAAPSDEQQAAEQQAIGEQVCKELRESLTTLQTHARLYERDEAGTITWLTETQKQQRITDAQRQLAELCQ
jgi:hypothetical protein